MSPAPARRRRRPPKAALRRLRSRWSFLADSRPLKKTRSRPRRIDGRRSLWADLPDVVIGGQVIDDVLIEASGVLSMGLEAFLARRVLHLRPAAEQGATALIPARKPRSSALLTLPPCRAMAR